MGTAKSGLPTANVSRDQNGSVVIEINANAKNPLVPFPASLIEPGIRPNLTVTIPTDASSATVTGQSSAFPAQEVNGTVGTVTNPLFQFSPAGTNPIYLYKMVQVSQTKPLPLCMTDADGRKACQ